MRVSNFINLAVVSGFFIGLAVGIMEFDEPEYMLFMTIVVTITMYLISLTMATLFIRTIQSKHSMMDNKDYIEQQLEYFDNEFDQTERQARSIRAFIRNFDLHDEAQKKAKM